MWFKSKPVQNPEHHPAVITRAYIKNGVGYLDVTASHHTEVAKLTLPSSNGCVISIVKRCELYRVQLADADYYAADHMRWLTEAYAKVNGWQGGIEQL